MEAGDRRPVARAHVVRPGPNAWVEVTVVEGRKHQVRAMLEAIGHPVQRLRRIRYDGVELGSLATGRLRPLTAEEVARLRRASRTAPAPPADRESG
ncbi:MAG: hypothetical protein LAO51_20295 [Acidobacteriia bacterium]|nr:hypothetical protein [Terriglobia bacterium]